MYLRGVFYTNCEQVADWAVNLTLTLKKGKGKCLDLNVCLKRIFKCTIFSGAGYRLALKMFLYVEP